MIGEMIAQSADIVVNYAQRMAAGIPEDSFARFPAAGDRRVETNHPAFIYGHLSLYPSRIVDDLGGDTSGIGPQPADEELFSPAAKCVDDPGGNIYPASEVLLQRYFKAMTAATEALRSASDEQFMATNPNEKMRTKFGTIGAMHGFYIGGHSMMHIGQLSAWRRVMGLPPA